MALRRVFIKNQHPTLIYGSALAVPCSARCIANDARRWYTLSNVQKDLDEKIVENCLGTRNATRRAHIRVTSCT